MTTPVILLAAETQANNVDGQGSFWRYRERSKQSKPYNIPAPYEFRHVVTTGARLLGSTTSYGGMANASTTKSYKCIGPWTPQSDTLYSVPLSQALNDARNRLVGKLNEEAMLAVNWHERNQSVDMIKSRALQILSLYRATRNRARFGIPKRATRRGLKQASEETVKGIPRSAAKAWLEFHFGVEPLIKDIGNAVELLQGPLPSGSVNAKGGRVPFDYDYYRLINALLKESVTVRIGGWVQAKAGAEFYVDNPDLYLANKLGFVNPASFVWELVPWSFVVDWFANVGDFLNQFSDLSGLQVTNPYSTWIMKVPSCAYTYKFTRDSGKTWNGVEVLSTGIWLERSLGIPSVTLGLRPLKRVSPVRAATAISLLVGLFAKERAKSQQKL